MIKVFYKAKICFVDLFCMSEICETIFLFTFRLLPREYKKAFLFFRLGLTSYVCAVVCIDFSFSGYKLDLNVTYGYVFTQNIILKNGNGFFFSYFIM